MSRLAGKVALVTGSTSGIGEAIVRRFAAEGARVAIHGIDDVNGRRVESELGEANAKYFRANLSDPAQCASLIAAVAEAFGRIDILVNNAAITTRSNIETTDAQTLDRIMAVNCRAPILLIQAAMPHFRAASGGAVLNIGSINAYGGNHNLLAYSVSKGALTTMTRNLADSLGEFQVRVNQLNPDWVLTPNEDAVQRGEGQPDDWHRKIPKAFAPSGRLTSPEEVAHYAVAFVEDGGGFVTGSVVDIGQYPFVGRNPDKRILA